MNYKGMQMLPASIALIFRVQFKKVRYIPLILVL